MKFLATLLGTSLTIQGIQSAALSERTFTGSNVELQPSFQREVSSKAGFGLSETSRKKRFIANDYQLPEANVITTTDYQVPSGPVITAQKPKPIRPLETITIGFASPIVVPPPGLGLRAEPTLPATEYGVPIAPLVTSNPTSHIPKPDIEYGPPQAPVVTSKPSAPITKPDTEYGPPLAPPVTAPKPDEDVTIGFASPIVVPPPGLGLRTVPNLPATQYGVPIAPLVTSNPTSHIPKPDIEYGPPQAPVVTFNPTSHIPKPDIEYGPPRAPVVTSKPSAPIPKPDTEYGPPLAPPVTAPKPDIDIGFASPIVVPPPGLGIRAVPNLPATQYGVPIAPLETSNPSASISKPDTEYGPPLAPPVTAPKPGEDLTIGFASPIVVPPPGLGLRAVPNLPATEYGVPIAPLETSNPSASIWKPDTEYGPPLAPPVTAPKPKPIHPIETVNIGFASPIVIPPPGLGIRAVPNLPATEYGVPTAPLVTSNPSASISKPDTEYGPPRAPLVTSKPSASIPKPDLEYGVPNAPLVTSPLLPIVPFETTQIGVSSPFLEQPQASARAFSTSASFAPNGNPALLTPFPINQVIPLPGNEEMVFPSQDSTQFHTQDGNGGFSFQYSNPQSARQETLSDDGVTRGSYSYIDANGQMQHVVYTADDVHGFRVSGTNIPVA